MLKFKTVHLLMMVTLLVGCNGNYKLKRVEGSRIAITAAFDKQPNKEATAILSQYKRAVDSISSPVIGYSDGCYTAFRPESPLSNFAADVVFEAGSKALGKKVDFAVTNMGGLRNDLLDGPITYGTISNIFPFENALVLLKMKGSVVLELFQQIAQVRGEAISGAQLELSSDYKLVKATINKRKIIPSKTYTVATIDYLAAGNDGMSAFKKGELLHNKPNKTIRLLVIDHIQQMTAKGKHIKAAIEGRIIIK
ncbi:MAG: 5'-nucleotidase [Bacteroidaceae bacterium]